MSPTSMDLQSFGEAMPVVLEDHALVFKSHDRAAAQLVVYRLQAIPVHRALPACLSLPTFISSDKLQDVMHGTTAPICLSQHVDG